MSTAAALDGVPLPIVVVDGRSELRLANRRWAELSGLSPEQSQGQGWLAAIQESDRLRQEVALVDRTGEGQIGEFHVTGPSGGRSLRWSLRSRRFGGERVVAIGGTEFEDPAQTDADLYRLATHDSLTGLANRQFFVDNVEQALRRSRRTAEKVCVLSLDLDGFKRFNDAGGHHFGDRVLETVGHRLRAALRGADLVARLGGDEFAALLDGINEEREALTVSRRLQEALGNPVEMHGERVSIAASIGLALSHDPTETAEQLMARADRALYTSKEEHRGDHNGRGEAQSVAGVNVSPGAELAMRLELLRATIDRLAGRLAN